MSNFMMYFMAKIFVHYLENISKTSQMVQMVLHLVILEKKSFKKLNTKKYSKLKKVYQFDEKLYDL